MKQEPKLIDKITTDEVLDQAYRWICKSRENTSCNNSIWDLRFNWEEDKEKLKDALRNNCYHLSPLRRYSIDGQGIDCWEACDAVVLKAIAIVLAEILEVDIPLCCTYIKGHGGSKKAVLDVHAQLKDYKFVFKSDIKSFYQSIDHQILLTQLKKKISDKTVLRLIYEYCNRLVWINGEYSLIDRGISLGCPLSPLFGAWFLQEMDLALMQQNVYYTRFMDDWLVLARTRNHLRKAIKATERILSRLKLEKHPDRPGVTIESFCGPQKFLI
jgi:RNA-directed DNA polymerase